jgi:hypothetical protein
MSKTVFCAIEVRRLDDFCIYVLSTSGRY